MAQITIVIPDEKLNDFIDAWGDGWRETDPNGEPNPPKPLYAKQMFRDMAVRRVLEHKEKLARMAAQWDDTGIDVN